MTDLRPPPRNEKFLWHWIETPCGAEPWMWCDQMWTPASCRVPSDMTIHTGCRYLYPADPAAVTLDPDDERQIEAVRGAIDGITKEHARAVIEALKARGW
jgi:hypothetical protein